jgi:tryptophan-rich sensory protein
MKHYRHLSKPAWWKQDLLAALTVVIYLAVGAVVVLVWRDLSHEADGFSDTTINSTR